MLLGRDRELATIDSLIAGAAEQTPFVLGVSGAAGSGRSAIADRARRAASDHGSTVLATRGSVDDADLAYAGLLTLLRPLARQLEHLAGDLVDPLRAALAMRRDRVDVLEVRLAVLRVLTAAADERPITVVIDDADRLDAASLDALRFALGRLGVDRVGAIATSLDGTSPFDTVATHRFTLGPLHSDVLAGIVMADVECVPAVAEACAAWADGNPLAAIELARSLTDDERAGRAHLPAVPRPTARVVEAAQRELDALSPAAQRALVVVAADRSGSARIVLAALAALGETDEGLDEAEAHGLVSVEDDCVGFRRVLLRPMSYRLVAASSRRAAHRALATVLVEPQQAVERAFQLVASCAGPDADAADALDLVGADAHRRGACAEAASILERAARLSVDEATRVVRLRRAALAALDAFQLDDAVLLAEESATAGDREAMELAIEAVERRDGASVALDRAGDASPATRADLLVSIGRTDDARTVLAGDADRDTGALATAVRDALAGSRTPTSDEAIDRVSASGRRAHRRRLLVAADAGFAPRSPVGVDELLAASIVAERAGRRDDAIAACLGASALLPAQPSALAAAISRRLTELEQAAPDPILSLLTKAERRVAEVVADGRTNREVADLLFLSVKTVDFHLQSVYRKLQVRSRTELAVRLARGGR